MQTTWDKLSVSSQRHFVNPHEVIDWPSEIGTDLWCMSPELISLYNTPAWASLGENSRKRLSFWELINFFSVNLHGESALLEGVAQRVNQERFCDISEYLRHMIDEENKHSMWFARFCRQYGAKVYAERKVTFAQEREQSETDFVFFAQIALFEELVDRFNVVMAADLRLHSVIREINRLHHADEARHLQFGRKLVEHLWQRWCGEWSPETVARIDAALHGYVETMWRQLYNPQVYRDAQIDDAARVARSAWSEREAFRVEMSETCLRILHLVELVDV